MAPNSSRRTWPQDTQNLPQCPQHCAAKNLWYALLALVHDCCRCPSRTEALVHRCRCQCCCGCRCHLTRGARACIAECRECHCAFTSWTVWPSVTAFCLPRGVQGTPSDVSEDPSSVRSSKCSRSSWSAGTPDAVNHRSSSSMFRWNINIPSPTEAMYYCTRACCAAVSVSRRAVSRCTAPCC